MQSRMLRYEVVIMLPIIPFSKKPTFINRLSDVPPMRVQRLAISIFIVILLLPRGYAQNSTYSETIITPHIGEGWETIKMKFIVEGESFTAYLVDDALYNLKVRDAQGDLTYEFGQPVLFGKRPYVPMTVRLRGGRSEFEISYDRETTATGTKISGEYWYYLKKTTDVAIVEYHLPLDNIEIRNDTDPAPNNITYGNPAIVTYRITKGDVVKITTQYMRRGGIDYKKTKTTEERVTVHEKEYTFILTYPADAEVLAEDVRFFVRSIVPTLIEETGYPLRQSTFHITLKEKGEMEWAAAVNRGGGTIEYFIETPHSYPSTILPHELIHSYIEGVPTFVNEGLANYFEGKVLSHYAPTMGYPSYYPPEWYWQIYERQYKEFVDIKTDYGESGTDKLESLISAKYDKGTYLIVLMERKAGKKTVREMLQIIAKRSENTHGPISLDYIISNLSENRETVYRILSDPMFGFDVSDPGKEETMHALQEMKNDSWWASLIAMLYDYEGKIKSARMDEMEKIRGEIERERVFAQKTLMGVDVIVIVFLIGGGILSVSAFRTMGRRNEFVVNQKRDTEKINVVKLKLVQQCGTVSGYEEEMAKRYGRENVGNEEMIRRFAEEMGFAEENH